MSVVGPWMCSTRVTTPDTYMSVLNCTHVLIHSSIHDVTGPPVHVHVLRRIRVVGAIAAKDWELLMASKLPTMTVY